MNTLNDALKPCPMCGKSVAVVTTSAEMWPDYNDGSNADSFAVMCDASAQNGPGGCGASGGFHPNEAKAIAAWNTRANTPVSSAAQGAMVDDADISAAMSEGNKHGVGSFVTAKIIAAFLDAQPTKSVIQLALDRIDRVQKRDGGPLWHTAKDVLKSDLDLIADGLRKYEAEPKNTEQKPIAWWNGLRNFDYLDGTQPAFSDIEDTNHDIPLYSRPNPCNAAQPTDATAQPSLSDSSESDRLADLILKPTKQPNLTDSDIIHKFETHCGWPNDKYPLKEADILLFSRALLLANTAQGKPEPLADQLKHSIYANGCAVCYGSGTDVTGKPCPFNCALAAKKG